MRICFLGDIRSTHTQKFIKYFSKEHDTHIISFDYIGDERMESGINFFNNIGTEIHILKKSHLLISPIITRSLIRKIDPDLLQAHFITNYGFLGAFSGVKPLVISAMGDDILIHPFKSIFYNWLVMHAINNSDFIICDGINSKNNLLTFGISPDKILVVYPGVNVQLFHPLYNIIRPDNNKMVFYPRGFDKIYDTDTLFSVISIINKINPNIKFMLLGLGTELERFKSMIISSGLEKSVKFLGQVPNNELPIYFALSDISITTSLSDGGIPVSTIEAMACGIPVISTDAGDAALWVRDDISGYVVKKQDPEQMANRIIELLNDDERRLQFGKNARKLVEVDQNYNLEMKKIENLYSKLIN